MNIKKVKQIIKKFVPDRVMYVWCVIQILPSYISVITKKEKAKIPDIYFYSDVQVVDLILKKGYSLSRFGDGEFLWMTGGENGGFQCSSQELSSRLREVFTTEVESLLIGIPRGVFDSSKNNLYSKMHWRIIRENYLHKLSIFIQKRKKFADASITRPYIDYHSRKESKTRFDNIKRIWDKKHVVIVEGKGTRLGVGNDLLSNSIKIERIICPSTNAFSKLHEIEETICNLVSKDTMILSALGPTATVLAYDMCKLGYQVIDIGHIDVEYVWFLRGNLYRRPINGKSVNESGSLFFEEELDCGKEYYDSIIAVIE